MQILRFIRLSLRCLTLGFGGIAWYCRDHGADDLYGIYAQIALWVVAVDFGLEVIIFRHDRAKKAKDEAEIKALRKKTERFEEAAKPRRISGENWAKILAAFNAVELPERGQVRVMHVTGEAEAVNLAKQIAFIFEKSGYTFSLGPGTSQSLVSPGVKIVVGYEASKKMYDALDLLHRVVGQEPAYAQSYSLPIWIDIIVGSKPIPADAM